MVPETTTDDDAQRGETTTEVLPHTPEDVESEANRMARRDNCVHVGCSRDSIVALFDGDMDVYAPEGYYIRRVHNDKYLSVTFRKEGH
jgi:hypothetical protein